MYRPEFQGRSVFGKMISDHIVQKDATFSLTYPCNKSIIKFPPSYSLKKSSKDDPSQPTFIDDMRTKGGLCIFMV